MAPMDTRGYSLANDLKFLINNKNYSDIIIICQDESIVYGNRAILAARSNVLDRLLFNGMKESTINEIKFPEIKSGAMEIILEYLYTENFETESISLKDGIEAYHAADYFQLDQLQQKIVNFVRRSLKDHQNLAPKLLSKAVEKMSPLADNEMVKLLIEWIAKTSLEVIGFDGLSFQALQCLLSQTYSTKGPFVTPEYTVFRYSVIQAANNVSENAALVLEKRLPNWNELNKMQNELNRMQEENPEDDSDENYVQYEEFRPAVKEMLSTILPFIDLRRIDTNILADKIEPLELLPTEILLDAYRFQAREKKSLPHMRGIPSFEWDLQWEKCDKGPHLILSENNSVVESNHSGLNTPPHHQNVRANNLISGEGIYEWEVIIEETCVYAWVGVCSERGLDYNIFAGQQSCAWVLGSSGKCYHNNIGLYYVPEFSSGTKITVHLDMTERSIAFSINGIMHPPVSNWTNLPSKLYPVASLSFPGRIRLGPVRDWNHINPKNKKIL